MNKNLASRSRGIDTNQPLRPTELEALVNAGYSFLLRYIPRVQAHPNDLTVTEVQTILAHGLALMPVQHVEPGTWTPTAQKGTDYGKVARTTCQSLGFPMGTSVWLDLESVDHSVPPTVTIDYATHWFEEVSAGGYQPGLYVGYDCGLSSAALYHSLPFKAYWGAYNLDRCDEPLVRGLCMKQMVQTWADKIPGVDAPMDLDVVQQDQLGGLPVAMA